MTTTHTPSYRPVNRASSRWCFTLNNHTPEELTKIRDFGNSDDVKYMVFGHETSSTGTPHLQGFVILNRVCRITWVKSRTSDRIYLDRTRGKSSQAREYCQKEGEYEEFGEFPDKQGKRSDLDDAIVWMDEFTEEHGHPPTIENLAKAFPSVAVKYGKALIGVAALRAPKPVLRTGTPRSWQVELENILNEPADDRKIRFYVDGDGGTGKSWFQGYYVSKYPETTQLLGLGKRDDIAYAIDPTKKVFFFNVPRGGMQYLQYTVFEQLKDKVVFSTKYQSTTKILRHYPHVVIFCNEEPDMTTMSADRYDITRLTGDDFTEAMAPGINN